MKRKLYKLLITLLVCMSLSTGPLAQKEIARMLEHLSGTRDAQIQLIDEEEEENESPKKRQKRK